MGPTFYTKFQTSSYTHCEMVGGVAPPPPPQGLVARDLQNFPAEGLYSKKKFFFAKMCVLQSSIIKK